MLTAIRNSLIHLLFPHLCDGCGSDLVARDSSLCLKCIASLPVTGFEQHAGNPVEKKFYGRLPLEHGAAHCYFGKDSLIQELVHQVKYRSNRQLGIQLGSLMGEAIKKAGRFDADLIIPLPLFSDRERKRGYNQAMLLCEGLATHLKIPIVDKVILRPSYTETQTKKGRMERWKNMEGKFVLTNPSAISGKHILLVDDVITTGATLEACGTEILNAGQVKLSLAALCLAYS